MFSNVSCCPIIILLLSNFAHGSRRRHTSQIEINGKQTAVWTRLLQLASNGTGEVSRDLVLETLIEKIFTHLVKPKISNGEELLGSRLDPFWLFPIGPLEIKKKSVFKGQLTACNLHLHNMKAIELVDIEVQRNEVLSTKAVKLILKIPIIWVTGDYWVKKGKLFGFIPSSGHGSFNIDVKDVKVGVIASLGTNSNESVTIEDFEIGFRWKRSLVKLDSQRSDLDKITDLALNKMNIGNVILQKKRLAIMEEIETYARRLFECILHDVYEGPSECMKQWWIDQGWVYPWVYPTCG